MKYIGQYIDKTVKVIFSVSFISVFFLYGCTKYEVSEPDFSVSLVEADYHVGDSVRFRLTGNADIITFYSGVAGNNYDSIVPQVLSNNILLSFKAGLTNSQQQNQLSVLVSLDYSGKADSTNIYKATWIDITNRFNLPTEEGALVDAGMADVVDLITDNQPFYVAYRYTTNSQTENGPWTQWEITDVLLKSVNSKEKKSMLTEAGVAEWKLWLSPNYEASQVSFSNSAVTFKGNDTNITDTTAAWVITGRVFPYKTTSYAPDYGKNIKAVHHEPLRNYATSYDKPGVYTVAFVGQNIQGSENKTKIEKLQVTVNPKD